MVIDYRFQNSQTIVDTFPIVRIADCLESLGSSKAKYFSTLDLQSGYHQVPIAKSSKQYTAFVTHDGLYEFNRMSFGLTNAPACFSRLMTHVLQNLNWEIALLYLDDIIVFSKDFKGHITNLEVIFQRLRQAKLTLKPSKCVFGRERIKFLGHVVSVAGLEPQPEKCADYNHDYILYTDASSEAIEMVLSQVQEGKERVISYGGKKLSPAEKRFSTTEQECLAVIVAMKHFESYLRGVHVMIVTDHAAL